ncbi:dihydroorotate dehydrogenase [Ruminiclostridium cellulolyticum]|uniref:Dihydroorotate dehydrogenase n=1 Tax=Ruminiclostridium cellulolyticum (strain ATCC 35319 / DSM 5812 / JCM 6584 / H10) TaxID=394503 RepID=B8I775_RUMCH|nr:dihydroorotate dehydrogenase [Ruminiclostridium cellulolyticum]ACL74999.1 dihydroorotate dehydrogenase family protein [Ruminiclostridium cellulolyticum H10]
MSNRIDLSVDIAGIRFNNPVIMASGTYGFGKEYSEYVDLNQIGGISVKGLTLKERKGNKPPRIAETPAGILNSVGLQNPGVESFIKDDLPFLKNHKTKIIANIAGNTIEEYCEMAEILASSGVDAIEMNVSCPNVKAGCLAFGTTPKGIEEITSAVKKYCKQPLIVKLTPNVSDIRSIAVAAEGAGADCISLINTILGLAIDINKKKPILANNFGGLSGPAVKPIALRMVYEAAHSVKIPVIGMGGISSWEDAIEFILAGASAIMVGTANFVNPIVPIEIISGIEKYLQSNGHTNVNEIVGKLELND